MKGNIHGLNASSPEIFNYTLENLMFILEVAPHLHMLANVVMAQLLKVWIFVCKFTQ
jgi:hypothetical protein